MLGIGFTSWLIKESDEADICKTIEKKLQVEVIWPNTDNKPSRRMKTVLKNPTIEWKIHALHIIASGGRYLCVLIVYISLYLIL